MRMPFLVVVLTAALPAQRELLDELPPDGEAWEHRLVIFGPEFQPLTLPGDGAPKGLARSGDSIWFARGDRLLRLSWPDRRVGVDLEAPAGLCSLCGAGRLLYGLADDGLLCLDPIAGRTIRTVALDFRAADGSRDAALAGLVAEHIAATSTPGTLLVATRAWWFEVDAATGVGERGGNMPRLGVQWLAHDGEVCWSGRRVSMDKLASGPFGEWSVPQWPWPLRAGAAAWVDGRLLLAGERGDPGNEGGFVCGLLAVDVDAPVARQLTVDVHWVAANKRKWVIGPKPLYSMQACQQELVRLAEDPKMMVQRPDGRKGPMPVVVRSHPKVTNADVAAIWDAAATAGFTEIRCPPIEAFALAERRRRSEAEARKK